MKLLTSGRCVGLEAARIGLGALGRLARTRDLRLYPLWDVDGGPAVAGVTCTATVSQARAVPLPARLALLCPRVRLPVLLALKDTLSPGLTSGDPSSAC